MILRLLGLFLIVGLAGAFGQPEIPGLFGKITAPPRAGDLAQEISFVKVLHQAAAEPWTSASLSGQVTVLYPFPYVSGNPTLVDQWNALVEKFAGKPVQFVWVAGEEEAALLPFLQQHPMKGWLFHDPSGATGQSYGLENPQAIFIGADRSIIGFDWGGPLPREEAINAVLDGRVTLLPPNPTFEQVKALAQKGRELLSAEAQQTPRPEDHRPNFSPSYIVHIVPAKDPASGGNFAAMDYWSLQSYTVRRLLSEMSNVTPIRIELPASVDTNQRYDIAIVLPRPEEQESMRSLIRQGVEDYFHLAAISENRLRDVYVVTAPTPKLAHAAADSQNFGFSSSMGFFIKGDADGLLLEAAHGIDVVSDVSMPDSTVDEFCHMLEGDLDRPVVNETKLDGKFDFQVTYPTSAQHLPPKHDFVERLRDQLGLLITPAQRYVETVVYRQH